MPYFNNCATVWGSASKTSLSKLNNLHQQSVQIANKPLLTFPNQLIYNKSIFAFQVINNITPSYVLNKLNLVKSTHSYKTRSNSFNEIAIKLKRNTYSNQLLEHDIPTCFITKHGSFFITK